MNPAKYKFLKEEFTPLLKKLSSTDKGKWGVMNAQQMVEHLAEYVRISSGRLKMEPHFTGEKLEKARSFLMTEIPFKENTPNALMPAEPPPTHQPDMQSAIIELQQELDYFFKAFEEDRTLTTMTPFFGELDFEKNIQLLHKHAIHHLKQFGLYTTI
jgi:hypothetical protein